MREDRAGAVAVPCGNFGNLYPGLPAVRTGLPVRGFVVATTTNATVPHYLDTGDYRERASVPTLSNAMDVGAPSNWEQVQALFSGDLEAMRRVLRNVARFLGVGWNLVKSLFYADVGRRLRRRTLGKIRHIAVDELATHKGHR